MSVMSRNTFYNTQNADPQSHPQYDRSDWRTHFRAAAGSNSAIVDATAIQAHPGLRSSGKERPEPL